MVKLAVFDLDGTLITQNSFHLWLKYLLRWSFFHFRWVIITKLISLMILRGFRLISHIKLKKNILIISLMLPEKERTNFAKILLRYARPELLERIKNHKREGLTVVIATAALDVYLTGFAELCLADNLLATSSQLSTSWYENLNERKLQSIKEVYGSDILIEYAYSDHSDDLPLLSASKKAFVVAPSEKQWYLLTQVLINCHRLL